MLVEQAIFTSVCSGRNEGYQVAASSSGISSTEIRELAQWGPGHDSLYDHSAVVESTNFHQLESGRYSLSHTVLAGREYSGRGGQRVYTHIVLLTEEMLGRFGNNPFRVAEALIAGGRLRVLKTIPHQLDAFPLVGRASPIRVRQLEQMSQSLGPRLAYLVNVALAVPALGVTSETSTKRLFSTLLDLLPLQYRLAFSFTTGLKVSARRPYRLAALPPQPEEHRRAVRQTRLTSLDLNGTLPSEFAPTQGWALLIQDLLGAGDFEAVELAVDLVSQCEGIGLDEATKRIRSRLLPNAAPNLSPFDAAVTPFSS
jgi:hypothetical protein